MTNPVNSNLLKVGDYLLVGIILILTVFFTYNTIIKNSGKSTDLKAVILEDNKVVKTVDLRQKDLNETIEINNKYHIRINAQYGKIRFQHAECPDKLCLAAGWLSQAGDTAICMPGRVVVKIERNNNLLDTTSY